MHAINKNNNMFKYDKKQYFLKARKAHSGGSISLPNAAQILPMVHNENFLKNKM